MSTAENKIHGEGLVDQAEQYVSNLNGNAIAHLKSSRDKGLSYLKEFGFPGPKAEEYKFTRMTKAITDKFDFSKPVEITNVPLDLIADVKKKHEGANVLIFINGVYGVITGSKICKFTDYRIGHSVDT